MLKVMKINLNIRLNKFIEIKTESDIIQQDLTIFQKLLKIFTFIILINSVLKN